MRSIRFSPRRPSRTAALPWLITLPGSLAALAVIWFVIVQVFCADLAGRGS